MGGRMNKRKERGKDRRFTKSKNNKSILPNASHITIGILISIAVLVVSFYYNKSKGDNTETRLQETLIGLLEAEKSATVDPGTKIAIGFGSCQDIIVQSNEVIYDAAPKIPEHFFSIATKEEFLKVFAYFYSLGAAAERFISNSTLFEEIYQLAKRAPSARYFMGGNAPVMAKRFVKEGCEVLLGAQMSKALQNEFPKSVHVSGPTVESDDVHILLEYPAGQRWGPLIPPRANRFIIHNDHQNPKLSSFDSFTKQLENYEPDLFVVGGLQMMDNFPMSPSQQLEQLIKVRDVMKKQPDTVRIHFEMASFSDEGLMKALVDQIVPFADSMGMNEQELPNLYQIMKYGNISLVSESRPRIAVILDQARNVFKFLQNTKATNGQRKLTRLHVHTLAFQAIMVDKNSPWKNTLSAAAKSALTANRHTCGSDNIDIKNSKLIMDDVFTTSLEGNSNRMPFKTKNPVSCWSEADLEICIAPVLVCTRVLQTGGGGDNISSAGLVLQI